MAGLSLLPLELRFIARRCARAQFQHHTFCTSAPIFKLPPPVRPLTPRPTPERSSHESREARVPVEQPQTDSQAPSQQQPDSTELVPRPDGSSAIGRQRKAGVPVKVLPKAKLSEELTLSPKERMQIEFLTRTQPRRSEKRLFRDQLLIYHAGVDAESALVFSKVVTLFALSMVVFIVAPAYYVYGDPWWKVLAILAIGAAPMFVVHWYTRSFVTWIYLPLPPYARQTAKTALEYAKNLPASARLIVNFKRLNAWGGKTEVHIADLIPAKSRWPPTSFEDTGRRLVRGPWYSPNPTAFYVREKTATHGKAARDTIPGIWEHVYRRIMKLESEALGKWKP